MSALHDLIRAAMDRADEAWIDPTSTATTLDGYLSDIASSVESSLVEATGGPEHLVRVNRGGWTIQHPLPERFEPEGTGTGLLDCKFNALVSAAMAGGAMFEGTHRVWIDRSVLQWEEVDRG